MGDIWPTTAAGSVRKKDCWKLAITKPLLKRAVRHASDDTFNKMAIDNDMSTNDMVIALANGAAENTLIQKVDKDYHLFREALEEVCREMAYAMIREGDIVIFRRQETAQNGDMVAVWLTDRNETTLKYFHNEGSRIRLQPAHPDMEPIFVDPRQVRIEGKVLSVIRHM